MSGNMMKGMFKTKAIKILAVIKFYKISGTGIIQNTSTIIFFQEKKNKLHYL